MSINSGGIAILSLIFAGNIYLLTGYNDRQVMAESMTDLTSTPSKTLNFYTYENSTFGIRIQYPSDWKKVEDDRGIWFRTTNESVNLRVESLAYLNRTLDNLTKRQINLTAQQFPGQSIIELNSVILRHNYPGHKIVFTYPEEPTDLQAIMYKEMQFWTVRDGRAYIFSYFTTADAYDNYLPLVKKIIDSFEIIRADHS